MFNITVIRSAIVLLSMAISLLSNTSAATEPLPGQIIIDPDHPQWLKRHSGKHVYFCGPGDPEDFLYRGSRNSDGTRDGDQRQLIQKLIDHGGNSIYVQAVRSHGGDAKKDHTQNPYLNSDPSQGLDARILTQWEEWFTLMDDHGILIYFFFYDDGARPWNTGDEVGLNERAFIEGIVHLFQHHKNLIWIIGEESEERYSSTRVQAIAAIVREADQHGHVIGNHHLSGTTFKAWQPDGALRHYSMQLTATGEQAHAGAIEALAKAGGRYQVIYAESTATPEDPAGMRRHAWEVAMGGLMPLLLKMDIAHTPSESLQQCRYLQTFFESTEFYRLSPHDELRAADTKYVLAEPGRTYIAYSDQTGQLVGIKNLPAGRCNVSWVDCQSGQTFSERHVLDRPGDHFFAKPVAIGPESAAAIHFPNAETQPRTELAVRPQASSLKNAPPAIAPLELTTSADARLYIQLKFMDDDGPGPYTYTIVDPPAHGRLTGDNNDRYYTPNTAFIGSDVFRWRVNDGQADSPVATVKLTITRPATSIKNP